MVDDAKSVFSIDDFRQHRLTTFTSGRPTALKRILRSLLGDRGFECFKTAVNRSLPTIDRNLGTRDNFMRLGEILKARQGTQRVLIIGGGILGNGIDALVNNVGIEFIESDVAFAPRTRIILDAHDIPFADESFDAVIAQAVLEHVVDPNRCTAEIYRVLKGDGYVYAETPFMQQVHAGRYDFQRFTDLGHRRLFRRFDLFDSGNVFGPGMALARSYQ
jgi:SAM-dependent methyltransferase